MRPRGFGLVLAIVAAAAPVFGQESGRVLVMPFENATGDPRYVWLREASAVLLADDLHALGVAAITRDERRAAFDRLQVPLVAALSDATVIRIGQLLGAAQVIVGSVALDGGDLVLHARSISLDAALVVGGSTERGAPADLYASVERLARAVVLPSMVTVPAVPHNHPPLAAFEQYVKGLVAETPATAVQYLNAAIVQYPGFARARLALWEVYTGDGQHERALAAVRAVPASNPWATRAQWLAGLSYLSLDRLDDAFKVLTDLARLEPGARVFNNLGVTALRRGVGAGTEPAYYFGLAAQEAPADPDYCFNLGYAYWRAGDATSAIYWLREAVRRAPADADAHVVLSVALSAAGEGAEANRERDLARRLSAVYEAWAPGPDAGPVPPGLERLKTEADLPATRTLDEALLVSSQRGQQELTAFHVDRARRLYDAERDREALGELARALFVSPYDPAAHILTARLHLRGGRLQDAIDALKISLWSTVTAEAHGLLAEAYQRSGDAAAADVEARRALALDPESALARAVLAWIEAAGDRPQP